MYNMIERRERPAWIGDKCKDCIYRCEECERRYNRVPETQYAPVVILRGGNG